MMNKEQKKQYISDMTNQFEKSEAVIVTHYQGLTMTQLDDLRAKMREHGIKFKITNNRITKLALEKTKCKDLSDLFTGPTAIGSSEDELAPAKVLFNFTKETEKLRIIGGGVEKKSLTVDEITNLASLPSLDEVRSKLIGLLMAGPTKLVRIIKEPPSRLARILATRNN